MPCLKATWKSGFNPEVLADRYEKAVLNRVEEIKFNAFIVLELDPLLYQMVQFSEYIPEIDARQICDLALTNVCKKGKITHKGLLSEINKLLVNYQMEPVKRFVLITSISISKELNISNIHFGKDLLIFEKNLPGRFASTHTQINERSRKNLFADVPMNYLNVRIHVSAKTAHEAASKAIDLLDYFRGLINYQVNKHEIMRWRFGEPFSPLNKIVIGPVHSLHNLNGKLTPKDEWWYEPNFLGGIEPFNPGPVKLKSYLDDAYQMRLRIEKSNYEDKLQHSMIRYSRALDERIVETSFLKLWSILEYLTNTSYGNYDHTIERASFLLLDRDLKKQILQSLREVRNGWVHQSMQRNDMVANLYQLKYFVEVVLGFHVYSEFSFSSIEDAGTFLSLPSDPATLIQKIDLLQSAKKFQENMKS